MCCIWAPTIFRASVLHEKYTKLEFILLLIELIYSIVFNIPWKSLSSLQWGFSSESLLTSLLCSLIQPVCIAESPINQLFGQLNCWFIMKLELIDKNCRCFCVPGCSLVRLSPPLKQCMLCEVDLHWSSKGFSRIGRSAFRNIISFCMKKPTLIMQEVIRKICRTTLEQKETVMDWLCVPLHWNRWLLIDQNIRGRQE